MVMMKRTMWMLTAIFLLMIMTGRASADSIYEPRDDFYNDHYNETTRIQRKLIANGPNGIVKGYKSPENAQVLEEIENGKSVDVLASFTDVAGIVWALHAGKGVETEYWIPMLYLMEPFDEAVFLEQYKEEIRMPAEGEPEAGILEHKALKLYSYPAGKAWDDPDLKAEDGKLSASFKDAGGHTWYRYTLRDTAFWLCSDMPEASLESLYPDGIPEMDKRVSEKAVNEPEIKPQNRTLFKNAFFILLGLSGAAMIAMAIIVNVGVSRKFRNNRR